MPEQAELPNVLVLSGEIPQTLFAGGIVLHRLLSGHPADRLLVIGQPAQPSARLLGCTYRFLQTPLRRLEKTRFSCHKKSLAAMGLVPLPTRRTITRLIGNFRPDVILCVMTGTPWLLTAKRTAVDLGVPLVLIVHDINEEFETVFPWGKKALFEKNRLVYRAAARRLCVSPEMAEFLEQRYGVAGEVMYPNRSEELQPRALDDSLVLRASLQRQEALGERGEASKGPEARGERPEEDEGDFDKGNFDILKDSLPATSNPLQASAPLTLGYAGSLAYGYGEALVDLIPVLREVGARILISTPRPSENLRALLEATDVVEWMAHRADIIEMWRTMQERADVMILPYMNPARSNELLYRTHFPSKLTEYLALGMPVIVSGPEFATGVRYANAEKLKGGKADKLTTGAEGRAGEPAEGSPKGDTSGAREATSNKLNHQTFQTFSVSEFLHFTPNGAVPCTTREELVACLQRLRNDGELRSELAKRAGEAGRRDFDPVEIRKRFQQILTEVCQ